MSRKPLRLLRILPVATACAFLAALVLFPQCQGVSAPVEGGGGGDLTFANPYDPDSSADSSRVSNDPFPAEDDPTQPHP
jgi:hypothetical protein